MIQQGLRNELCEYGFSIPVVTVVTQVLVEPDDPAFANPTKPVGQFYSRSEAERLAQRDGFPMREDSGRGWRRVVASPDARIIVEADAIVTLIESGAIVIASGGGGIPVVETSRGYSGVEAVIDKDLAAERLAQAVQADALLILTDVAGVALNYGTPEERFLRAMTTGKAREYLAQGQFPAGSMGPKVEAAVRFVENGGEECIISALDQAWPALQGQAGTRITTAP
jgi:carbamate kinase